MEATNWITGERAKKLLSEYESDVLDPHHQSLPFWTKEYSKSAFLLLGAYDAMTIVKLFLGPAAATGAGIQKFKSFEDSLTQALRWLRKRGGLLGLSPAVDSAGISDAGMFLLHASQYVDVADFHMAYRRELVDIHVDDKKRTVRFCSRSVEDAARCVDWVVEAKQALTHRWATAWSKRHETASIRPAMLSVPHRTENGRIIIEDLAQLNRDPVRDWLGQQLALMPREFQAEVNLGGFNSTQLASYFFGIWRWSAVALFLFISRTIKGQQQSECLPTQVVERDRFNCGMRTLTSLDLGTIELITERLTYDRGKDRPDMLLQPLLREGDTLAWSAHLVLSMRCERNMLKLMARDPKLKPIADTLIGRGEGPLLKEIGQLLASRGFQFKARTAVTGGGESGEVDILAWTHRAPRQVLIVEAKAILPPDEINEVNSATKVLMEAQSQLRKIQRILAGLGSEAKRHLFRFVPWSEVDEVWAVVLTKETCPNNSYDHSEIPAGSIRVMRWYLRPRYFKSPQRIVDALRRADWLADARAGHDDSMFGVVEVGSVRYELPLGALESPPQEQV